MDAERRATLSLALAGAAGAGLYALLALRYPLARSLEIPRAGWADLSDPTWTGLASHVAVYLFLTVLYGAALRLTARNHALPERGTSRAAAPGRPQAARTALSRARLLIVVLTWLACSAILMTAASSGESHDVFDYVFRGRMMVELGGNPLTEVPAAYPTAPGFHYLAWHDFVDTYGPVWEAASAATALVAREALQAAGSWAPPGLSCPGSPLACRSLIGYVIAYRLLAVALTGLSGWLIASMVRRVRPHLVEAALVAWLWSPLLLISSAVGAHNDAAMMVLLLLVLWLLQRRRWFPALLALVLAAHVKLTALVVAPAVGLWLVRCLGWRRAAGLGAAAAAGGLALSFLLYAPFGGWGSLPRMLAERARYLANSPWRVLYSYLEIELDWTSLAARRFTVGPATALSAAAVVLVPLRMLGFRLRRGGAPRAPELRTPGLPQDRELWRVVTAVTLLYLVLGSFWFQHWYVVWALAPAALTPDALAARRLLPWLGFGALSANVITALVPALAAEPLSKTAAAALAVATIWGPVLAFRLVQTFRHRCGSPPVPGRSRFRSAP